MTEKSNKKNEKQVKSLENAVFTDGTSRDNREGVDFYIEKGLYVFTEKYLKERGYCCENGCRHCPYKTAEKAVFTEGGLGLEIN